MKSLSRRQWLGFTALSVAGMSRFASAAPSRAQTGCTLGFSTYGMKTLPIEEAIAAIAEIGFDSIEITAHTVWDAAPTKMPPGRRKAVRAQLADSGLVLTSLMEHIYPATNDAQHVKDLERLKAVVRLGQDLSPAHVSLVQTVLGGGTWDEKRDLFRDRLGDWVNVCKEGRAILAIKPHRGGAMSKPSEAAWLIQQLDNTPWLRMVYDYSHYAFRDLSIEQTVKDALPYTAHIAVKDAFEDGDRVGFALPGEHGTIDFVKILRLFYEGGYRDDISCEVSGMVSGKEAYDPNTAAKTCYENMAPLFEKAGVPRGV
ncbi:MAG: sugar phosphate isomerase/epimerase [Candidatus Hydrogenedentes bacterium]|nr:sugar phosphate isomerase/epimerase [Candidatus Hydrogenedentota bacterium]